MRILRAIGAALGLLALAGCYPSATPLIETADAIAIPGMSEGIYCHAENRLIPPQVSVSPQISEALGENKCRDLHWDAARNGYIDRMSPNMELLVSELYLPELLVLQARTGPGSAIYRLLPIAAVDGMFILYDGASEWPEGLVEASGLELLDDGTLAETDPSHVAAVVGKAWDLVLQKFREDVAFVEDAAGPRLEFRRADTAYSYLVYFKQDQAGYTGKMRASMLALADSLGLVKSDTVWTEQAE